MQCPRLGSSGYVVFNPSSTKRAEGVGWAAMACAQSKSRPDEHVQFRNTSIIGKLSPACLLLGLYSV